MNNVRTKISLFLATALGALVLTAGSAFADNAPPTKGPAPAAAKGQKFSCDAANARLAKVNARIAAIQARIASGHVKNADAAAHRLKAAQDRAANIQARIAKRC